MPILFLSLLAPGQTPKGRNEVRAPRLRVVLDPGHGGEDQGASGPKGLLEKDAVLDLASILADQLREIGLEVQLTRSSDVLIPLWDRARMANEAGADLFISLHLNAARTRQAKGSEVYFLTLGTGDRDAQAIADRENAVSGAAPGPGSSADNVVAGILEDLSQKAFLQDSERLAVSIQNQLNELGGIKQRGVKQAPFVVLRGAAMPAVLVETAFISNPREEAKLRTPLFRRQVAQAITRGVRRFFAEGAVTPRRKAILP